MVNKQIAAPRQAYVFLVLGDSIRGDDEVLGEDFTAWVPVHLAATKFIGSPYAAIMKPVRRPVASTAAPQPDERAVSRTLEQVALRAVQLYAESRPRPSQVTMTQAAAMLGISRHTVGRMVRAGQMKLNRCGLIPIEQVDRMLQPV